MSTNEQPFWKDEPEIQSVRISNTFMPFFRIYNVFLLIFFASIPAYFLSLISKYLGLAWLGLMVFTYGLSIYQRRYRKHTINNIEETQKRAKETIGASYIGGAIRVAGHPLLQRDHELYWQLLASS